MKIFEMIPNHVKRSLKAGLVSLALAAAIQAAPSLPIDLALTGSGLQLELSNAVVEVVMDPGAEPRLSVQRLTEGEGAGEVGVGALDLVQSSGGWRLVRLEGASAPLLVRAFLLPGQGLSVSGRRVELSYQGTVFDPSDGAGGGEASGQEGGGSGSAPETAPVPLSIDLKQAQIDLYSATNVNLRAEESHVGMEATGGPALFDLVGSTLDLRDHSGRVEIVAETSELSMIGQRGRLKFTLTQTDLLLAEGGGMGAGSLAGGQLQIENRHGGVRLQGEDARVTLRQAGGGEAQIQLGGRDLDLTLEGVRGKQTIELVGGSLRGGELRGAVTVRAAQGAEVDLESVHGGLHLSLNDGALARLVGVRKGLVAELEDSSLDLEAVGKLSVTARRSRIDGREVRRVDQMELADSELDLSLANTNHSPTMIFKGASSARVELPAPCSVKILGRQMADGADVRASGCGIETAGHGRRRFQNRGLDGGRAVVLSAKLSEDSSLEVDGRP